MGRTLTTTGSYMEIHHYPHGFVERFIPKDKLSTIPGIDENAQRPLCVIIRTGKERNYIKVLGLHLTEDEYRMVQALNGELFQDVPYKKGDPSLLISLLKKPYRRLATRIKHQDGPHAHIYELLGMTEEEMIAFGKNAETRLPPNWAYFARMSKAHQLLLRAHSTKDMAKKEANPLA